MKKNNINAFDKLKNEGVEFRNTGFESLPREAQIQVLTYMRGVKDGLELAKKQNSVAV